MGPLLLLLLALIFFGLGFTLKILWWVAVALVVVWILGLAHPTSRQHYHWGNR